MTSWEWTSLLDSLIGHQAKQAIWFSRNLVSSVNVRNPSRTECTRHCIAHSYCVCDKMAVGSESGKKQQKKNKATKTFGKSKLSFELSEKMEACFWMLGQDVEMSVTHTQKNTNLVARSVLTCHTECLASEVYLKSSQWFSASTLKDRFLDFGEYQRVFAVLAAVVNPFTLMDGGGSFVNIE